MSAYGVYSLPLADAWAAVRKALPIAEKKSKDLEAELLPSYLAKKMFWVFRKYNNENEALWAMRHGSWPVYNREAAQLYRNFTTLEYFFNNITKESDIVPLSEIIIHITVNEYNLIKEHLY